MMANVEGNNHNGPSSEVINEFNILLTIIKVVIVAIFLLPLADYSIRTKNDKNLTEIEKIENVTIDPNNNYQEVLDLQDVNIILVTKTKEVITQTKLVKYIKETTCFKISMLVILKEILEEFVEKNEFCTPEDYYNINKHKIPKSVLRKFRRRTHNLKKEVKVPAIVNYAVGIILIMSLGAAIIEVYRAKRQPAKKNGKNSLSRKCSLADLTVMKHHRKEMLRRESLLEVPEEQLYSKLGNKPNPFRRQCSFPVELSRPTMGTGSEILSTNSRRFSIQATTRFVPVVDGRPATVLEGRRHSIVSGGRQPLIMVETNKSISLDAKGIIINDKIEDCIEKRYHVHGRRVHRH